MAGAAQVAPLASRCAGTTRRAVVTGGGSTSLLSPCRADQRRHTLCSAIQCHGFPAEIAEGPSVVA
jgi:hypothetical protein